MSDSNKDLLSLGDIIAHKKPTKKPPAYQWQELALQVIDELSIPSDKRSSIFQACRNNDANVIKRALTDTKELCKTGETWRYFFKLIAESKKK